MTAVTTSYIVLDNTGRALIEGTRTRVAMVVMDKLNGLTPEQIRDSYPYLSLSQIYGALAFYYDHQAEVDAEIAREVEDVSAMRNQTISRGDQPTRSALQQRIPGKSA